MQTEMIPAHTLQQDDFILYDGKVLQVFEVQDWLDYILLDTRDEDGEWIIPPYLDPFQDVELITSFEEE